MNSEKVDHTTVIGAVGSETETKIIIVIVHNTWKWKHSVYEFSVSWRGVSLYLK